ncbi:tRNA (adenine-N1)-methyltransferase [Dethiosulfatarculus sandiegensis]|uniref:tRNA (adenine(58)-N(1))-methyltransferase TrmI n=1 Tax=Dethiosulfatarculus sandiegensis TaxID=1429043 RepID=A0A0D2JCK8_9BACT|nr:class I SAM-dependent methyltransferase [Dethiosulfatarculus sandiegensis]KIX13486.1 hypothetical protein X474_13455 [Dethiosulfatarculus sandiegensis]
MSTPTGDFAPGDPIFLVDQRDRQYLELAPLPDKKLKLRDEYIPYERVMELHDGDLLISPIGRRYLVFKPTMREVVFNMPRQAQIIYPKDIGAILMWGDVFAGQSVLEVGCGHGAMTMSLLRCLGPTGSLVTCDLRRDHLNRTKKNIVKYLGESYLESWTPVWGNPSEGVLDQYKVERIITDIPEPWEILEVAAKALKPGGVWTVYVPTVTQMTKIMEAMNGTPDFCLVDSFELLQRHWHVKLPSVRPAHTMKAHTGFIITCRRRWRKLESQDQAE